MKMNNILIIILDAKIDNSMHVQKRAGDLPKK